MKRYVRVLLAIFACAACTLPAAAAGFKEEPSLIPIGDGHLMGTLTVPDSNGAVPVALIIAGSGPTDRDGNSPMLKTDAYKKLAAGLAAAGIATLRYDKRGTGQSLLVGESEGQLTIDDYVDDALAAASELENDGRFSRVFIIGHSEGSLIGTLAAQKDPKIRGFVSLEGPGRNLATIIDEQIRSMPGVTPDITSEVDSINASLLAGKTVPNPDPKLAALFRPSVQPYLISEYRFDPAKELAKLTIPVLIVHGSTDIQVSPTDASLLAAADPKARVANIDGMNHILVNAPADRAANIATYSQPALPLSPTLVSTIAEFMNSVH